MIHVVRREERIEIVREAEQHEQLTDRVDTMFARLGHARARLGAQQPHCQRRGRRAVVPGAHARQRVQHRECETHVLSGGDDLEGRRLPRDARLGDLAAAAAPQHLRSAPREGGRGEGA